MPGSPTRLSRREARSTRSNTCTHDARLTNKPLLAWLLEDGPEQAANYCLYRFIFSNETKLQAAQSTVVKIDRVLHWDSKEYTEHRLTDHCDALQRIIHTHPEILRLATKRGLAMQPRLTLRAKACFVRMFTSRLSRSVAENSNASNTVADGE